jgi:hypothetical protein
MVHEHCHNPVPQKATRLPVILPFKAGWLGNRAILMQGVSEAALWNNSSGEITASPGSWIVPFVLFPSSAPFRPLGLRVAVVIVVVAWGHLCS